jgi:hypothetical protein
MGLPIRVGGQPSLAGLESFASIDVDGVATRFVPPASDREVHIEWLKLHAQA